MRSRKFLKKRISKIQRLYKNLYNSNDPELLHKYRINLRKLDAYNECFITPIDPKISSHLAKLLKKLLKPTSHLRDLDLFVIEIKTLPCSKQCKKQLHTFFYEKQRREKKAFQEILTEKKYKKLLQKLGSFVSKRDSFFNALDILEMDTIIQNLNDKLYKRLYKAKKADVSLRQLHRLRVEFKKFRYAVEIYQERFGKKSALATKAQDLPQIQDLFGKIQDNNVRIGFLKEGANTLSLQDYTTLHRYFQHNIKAAKQQLFQS